MATKTNMKKPHVKSEDITDVHHKADEVPVVETAALQKKRNYRTMFIAGAAVLFIASLILTVYLMIGRKATDTETQEDTAGLVFLTEAQSKQVTDKKITNQATDITGKKPESGTTSDQIVQEAIKTLPPPSADSVTNYIDLADYQLATKQYAGAVQTYTSIVGVTAAGEQRMTVYVSIGDSYKALGNINAAKVAYQSAYAEIAQKDASYNAMKQDIQERINAL